MFSLTEAGDRGGDALDHAGVLDGAREFVRLVVLRAQDTCQELLSETRPQH